MSLEDEFERILFGDTEGDMDGKVGSSIAERSVLKGVLTFFPGILKVSVNFAGFFGGF